MTLRRFYATTSSAAAIVHAYGIYHLVRLCEDAHMYCTIYTGHGQYWSTQTKMQVIAKNTSFIIITDDKSVEIPYWIGCLYFRKNKGALERIV